MDLSLTWFCLRKAKIQAINCNSFQFIKISNLFKTKLQCSLCQRGRCGPEILIRACVWTFSIKIILINTPKVTAQWPNVKPMAQRLNSVWNMGLSSLTDTIVVWNEFLFIWISSFENYIKSKNSFKYFNALYEAIKNTLVTQC